MNTVYSKYRVEFGITSGLKGSYIGDTLDEVFHTIDLDHRLLGDIDLKNTLKYGYFDEFKEKDWETKDYVIDNCMHFMWTVKGED